MKAMWRSAFALLGVLLAATPARAQLSSAATSNTLSSTTCTGNPGAGSGCVVLDVNGLASASIQVEGTFSGTLTFYGSRSGDNYQTISATPTNSTTTATSTTSTGIWTVPVGGLRFLKVAFSSYSSGTATVSLGAALSGGSSGGGGGAASSVTINDPTTTSQKAAVNASGQLSITCANCSGSGASAVDEATFTQGTNSVAPAGILFKTSYTALTSGQAGIVRGTSDGSMFTNLDKVQGTNVDVNSGTKSAGTIRVVLATDQPALTNKLLVTPDLPTGASTAAKQPALGTAGSASSDVITVQGVASMTPVQVSQATASSLKAQVAAIDSGGTSATDTTAHAVKVLQVDASGNAVTVTAANPCESTTPTTVAISQATSTVTSYISATSAKKNFICSIVLVAGAAEIINIVEGTGANCTSPTAVVGSTTAANGMSFAANGGFAAVGGKGVAISGIGTNVNTCIATSGANRIAGWLSYVQQ